MCVCTRETDSLVRSSRLPTLSFSFRSLLVPPIIFKNTLGISRVCIDVAAKCRSSHPAESPGFAIEFRTRDIFSSRQNKVVKKKKIGRWLIQFQIDNSLIDYPIRRINRVLHSCSMNFRICSARKQISEKT